MTTVTTGSAPVAPRLLSVSDLNIGHRVGDHVDTLVKSAQFGISAGEIVCLVGESGSGKSLTAGAVTGLLKRNKRLTVRGSVAFEGRELTCLGERQLRELRGREIGMIFQDPVGALDPVIPIGKQIAESVSGGPVGHSDIRRHVLDLLARVGISDPEQRIKQFPHEISGGMCQRVAIAIAIAGGPKLLLADEPTTALDVTIQAQILDLLMHMRDERGMSMLLITHDMGVAARTADRIIVMYAGSIVEEGATKDFFARPGHPYSIGLIQAVPRVDAVRVPRLSAIPGSMPEASGRPSGCAFHPRCGLALDRCREEVPVLTTIGSRRVACHRALELHSAPPEAPPASPASVAPHKWDGVTAMSATSPGVTATGVPPAPLVDVRNLVKHYSLRHKGLHRHHVKTIRAVDGVTFSIGPGMTFGLVGESGCGKSTLGRLLLRLDKPTSGEVLFDGQDWLAASGEDLRRSRKSVQAIFQDPLGSLDPKNKVIVAVSEALEAHGMATGKSALEDRSIAILESVGLTADIGARYPHQLSGGQRQRVTIARAISLQPKFLVCDEAVSALDVSVQAQIVNLLDELQETLGVSYLFISHGLATVRHLADEIGVMYLGRLVERAPADQLFSHPAHPYTRALLAAVPVPDPTANDSTEHLRGEIPSVTNLPSGCRFRFRCPRAEERCVQIEPELTITAANHEVACHFPISSPVTQRAPVDFASADSTEVGSPKASTTTREPNEGAP